MKRLDRRSLLSLLILACALVLAVAPFPGQSQSIVVVSGTELQDVLLALQPQFERTHPTIKLDLKFQGSQDTINHYIDDDNAFTPTVLIPGNQELLTELEQRWRAQTNRDPFYEAPRPIAKSVLVGIAWRDRGQALFPSGRFDWNRLEQALQAGEWGAIGGQPNWGSMDFLITDPTRSNSAQLTLALWIQAKVGTLTTATLANPTVAALMSQVKRSVYQPPPSTDTLLKEFIARGANGADVATVYESVALNRWQQSGVSQGNPYQIYYIDPTIETVATAAIVQRDVSRRMAEAAQAFLEFLTQPQQQAVFVQYGFRPIDPTTDLQAVPNSPWSQSIPGANSAPPGVTPSPDRAVLAEILRLWQRAN